MTSNEALDLENMTIESCVEMIHFNDRKFRQTCNQIIFLQNSLTFHETRLKRANETQKFASKYSSLIKTTTLKGVLNMFHSMNEIICDKLNKLLTDFYQLKGREITDIEIELGILAD